jgi:hypothetical protein
VSPCWPPKWADQLTYIVRKGLWQGCLHQKWQSLHANEGLCWHQTWHSLPCHQTWQFLMQTKDYVGTSHRSSTRRSTPHLAWVEGASESFRIYQCLWWQKVWWKLLAGTVTSGARVLLLQQVAVLAVQLPQGVHGVFKAATAGKRVVQLTAWLMVLSSRHPGT